MTTLIKNADVRTVAAGINVTRAANTLPNGLQTIFNVTGGRVLLKYLVGTVTVALGATVTTLSYGLTPTGGSSAPTALGTATAITSATAAPPTQIVAVPGGATIVSVNGGLLVANYVLPLSAVTITTSAQDTGSVQWDLCYVPLDVAAQVTAA